MKPTTRAVCSALRPMTCSTAASMNSEAEGTGAVPTATITQTSPTMKYWATVMSTPKAWAENTASSAT